MSTGEATKEPVVAPVDGGDGPKEKEGEDDKKKEDGGEA